MSERAPQAKRRTDLDVMRGIAILLVVVFHTAEYGPDRMNIWYTVVRSAVYLFHMSIFIFVAGFLTWSSAGRALEEGIGGVGGFLGRRIGRLLLLQVVVAAAAVVGYAFASIALGRGVELMDMWQSFGRMVVSPMAKYDGIRLRQLWFLQALGLLSVAGCIATALLRRHAGTVVVLCVALLAVCLPGIETRMLSLNLVIVHLPVFLLGVAAARWERICTPFVKRRGFLLGLPFVALVIAMLVTPLGGGGIWERVSGVLLAVSAVVTVHWLSMTLSSSRTLQSLGRHSLLIYLAHPFVLTSLRWGVIRLGVFEGRTFILCVLTMAAAGLCVPLTAVWWVGRLRRSATRSDLILDGAA